MIVIKTYFGAVVVKRYLGQAKDMRDQDLS